MIDHPTFDKNGWQIVDAYDDRCPYYQCRTHALDVYRCLSCSFFDAHRCRHEGNRADAEEGGNALDPASLAAGAPAAFHTKEKEARDATQ